MAAEEEVPSNAPESHTESNSAPATDKHPLECKWTLWHDPGTSGGGKAHQQDWGQSLDKVFTFATVEDFWCLFNNIKPPSWLPHKTDLHLFKDGIKPAWEDPGNEKGGAWTYYLPKGAPGEQTDKVWLDALLACIGEVFTEGDDVCGISMNLRAKNRCSVWTRTAANESKQTSIGKELKAALGLDASGKIGYTAHADAMASISKEKYTV